MLIIKVDNLQNYNNMEKKKFRSVLQHVQIPLYKKYSRKIFGWIILGWDASFPKPTLKKWNECAFVFFAFWMLYLEGNCCRNFRRRECLLPLEIKNNYFFNISDPPPWKNEMNALSFFAFWMLYLGGNCCRNFRRRECLLTLPVGD